MKKILMFTGAILGITLLCNTKALAYDGNYNPVSVKNEQTYEETTDVQRNYTGIVKSGDKLVYVENGKIKDDYTGVREYNNQWLYVKNGVVDYTYTGIAENEFGWWRIENGVVKCSV